MTGLNTLFLAVRSGKNTNDGYGSKPDSRERSQQQAAEKALKAYLARKDA
jgi:hypothetical protein